MSMEPPYILNNFSNLDIFDHWALSYYVQAAFGLTIAPIYSMYIFLFTSINISVRKQTAQFGWN